jgi:tetratricopeptide (TPR) repeat protein
LTLSSAGFTLAGNQTPRERTRALVGVFRKLLSFVATYVGLLFVGAVVVGLLGGILGAVFHLYTWPQLVSGLYTARDITLAGIQFLILLLIAALVGLLLHWLSRPDNSLQLRPFDNVTGDPKLNGAGDVLMAEIQRIADIHLQQVPSVFGYAPTSTFNLGRVTDVSPALGASQKPIEPTSADLHNVGTVGFGGATIAIGDLLLAIKDIWPARSPTILSGSVQLYGERLRLVVRQVDTSGTCWWEAGSSEKLDVALPRAVSEIAYQFLHPRLNVGQANWVVLRHYTESLEAYFGYMRSNQPDDRDRARDQCVKAREAQPGFSDLAVLFYNLGNSYVDDKPDVAEAMYTSSLALIEDVDAIIGLGVAVDRQSRHDEAAEYFHAAVLRGYGLGYANYALWLQSQQRVQEAETLLREGLEKVNPEDNSYYYVAGGLASILHTRGDYEQALEQARRAVETAPKEAKHTASLEVGWLLFDLERFNDALEPLWLASNSDQVRVAAHLWLALSFFALGRPDDALHVARLGVDMDGSNSEALDQLSWIYTLLGRNDDAIVAEKRALELGPADPASLHLSLAGLFRKQGPAHKVAYRRQLELGRKGVDDNEYNRACLASIVGDTASALDLLESSLRSHAVSRAHANLDPDLDFIRGDPRYAQIMASFAPPSAPSAAPVAVPTTAAAEPELSKI